MENLCAMGPIIAAQKVVGTMAYWPLRMEIVKPGDTTYIRETACPKVVISNYIILTGHFWPQEVD